jgi:hypothetical protein
MPITEHARKSGMILLGCIFARQIQKISPEKANKCDAKNQLETFASYIETHFR